MDDRFFNGVIGCEVKICGYKLTNLTPWHVVILTAIDSPVIKEVGHVLPHDLLVFCKVVSCEYPNTPDLKPRLRDVFKYILTNRKNTFKENTQRLKAWMDVQTCSPVIWDVSQAEGASTREIKSPAMLALVMNLISKAGTTLKETWNMRLSEARWCDLTLSEINGNPVRFAYENEEQPAATLPDLSEKEIIAEAKKTLSQSSFKAWLKARKQNNIKN